MTEDRQEHPPRLINPVRVAGNRLGQRLVDCLVKPSQIIEVMFIRAWFAFPPKPKNAGPQGTVLGNHFIEIKTRADAADAVNRRSIFEPLTRFAPRASLAFGLARLLRDGLGGLHVANAGPEDS